MAVRLERYVTDERCWGCAPQGAPVAGFPGKLPVSNGRAGRVKKLINGSHIADARPDEATFVRSGCRRSCASYQATRRGVVASSDAKPPVLLHSRGLVRRSRGGLWRFVLCCARHDA